MDVKVVEAEEGILTNRSRGRRRPRRHACGCGDMLLAAAGRGAALPPLVEADCAPPEGGGVARDGRAPAGCGGRWNVEAARPPSSSGRWATPETMGGRDRANRGPELGRSWSAETLKRQRGGKLEGEKEMRNRREGGQRRGDELLFSSLRFCFFLFIFIFFSYEIWRFRLRDAPAAGA